jgi:hypothetical protein
LDHGGGPAADAPLQAVEPPVIRGRHGQEELDCLRHLLRVAEARVAQLEEQLMTLLAP